MNDFKNPTIRELAHMSECAYGKEKQPPEGWEIEGDSREYNQEKEGQYAILYKYKDTNTYVIAIRGTRFTSFNDLKNDISISLYGKSKSAEESLGYYEYINKKFNFEKISNFKIYVTGHSKGAFEAAYITKELESNEFYKDIKKNYIGSVGFNCPGFGLFRKIESPEKYKHINLNRESDVVSVELMPKIGINLELPNVKNPLRLLTGAIDNHAITLKNEFLTHYTTVGNMEVTETLYSNLNQDFINKEMILSRVKNIRFAVNTPVSKGERQFAVDEMNKREDYKYIKKLKK